MYEPLMTTADRHRQEGLERLQDGDVCPHGRPAGFSNYDVRWCGDCEREEYEESLVLEALAEHDETGCWPFQLGPYRYEFGLPSQPVTEVAASADDLPF